MDLGASEATRSIIESYLEVILRIEKSTVIK